MKPEARLTPHSDRTPARIVYDEAVALEKSLGVQLVQVRNEIEARHAVNAQEKAAKSRIERASESLLRGEEPVALERASDVAPLYDRRTALQLALASHGNVVGVAHTVVSRELSIERAAEYQDLITREIVAPLLAAARGFAAVRSLFDDIRRAGFTPVSPLFNFNHNLLGDLTRFGSPIREFLRELEEHGIELPELPEIETERRRNQLEARERQAAIDSQKAAEARLHKEAADRRAAERKRKIDGYNRRVAQG